MQDDDDVEDEEDSDSDVMEVEAEDPLSGGGAAGAEKKSTPNVVTIDDVKTLQRLANNAKKQVRTYSTKPGEDQEIPICSREILLSFYLLPRQYDTI